MDLSIVIPCLNEELTLGSCIQQAQACLSKSNIAFEIVVADNGSTDKSREIAESLGVRVVIVSNRGYGSALMGGIKAASGEFIVMADADGSYDFSQSVLILNKLRNGYDLVVGNRFTGGIEPGAMPFLHRYLGNPVLSAIGKIFFRSPVSDFHCGIRGFKRQAILSLSLVTTGMEFASELIIKATLKGCRIDEVPVTLSKDGRDRKPHLRTWRDGWRHLRFMLVLCPDWLYIYPGLAMIVIGGSVSARLLHGPIYLGEIGLDVHTLLYMVLLILIGFQAIFYGLFTKVCAAKQGLLLNSSKYLRITHFPYTDILFLVGALLFIIGFIATYYSLSTWQQHDFGSLNTQITLRTVVPAVLSIFLGAQFFLSGFFLSMLGYSLPDNT